MVIVISNTGKLITGWEKATFNDAMREVIEALFATTVCAVPAYTINGSVLMEKDKVMDIINDWDPIGVLPYSPKDEYLSETEKIIEIWERDKILDANNLADIIDTIFINSFGEDVYKVDRKNTLLLANKLLELK